MCGVQCRLAAGAELGVAGTVRISHLQGEGFAVSRPFGDLFVCVNPADDTIQYSMATTEVEKKFKKAVWLVRNGPPNPNAGTEEKLKFYSLYKQATVGDCNIAQPWAVQLEARAKWDAWNELKGMSKEEAMQKYIDLVAAGDSNWESHGAFKDYEEEA